MVKEHLKKFLTFASFYIQDVCANPCTHVANECRSFFPNPTLLTAIPKTVREGLVVCCTYTKPEMQYG